MVKKMLCLVIILSTVLCGCGQKREVRNDSASKQEETKELCVFYTPENEILIKNFENLYLINKNGNIISLGNGIINSKIKDIDYLNSLLPLMASDNSVLMYNDLPF